MAGEELSSEISFILRPNWQGASPQIMERRESSVRVMVTSKALKQNQSIQVQT